MARRDRTVKPENLKVSPERHAHLKKIGAKKGQPSRNPEGRKPIAEELKLVAGNHSPDSLMTLVWLRDNSNNDMVRLKAAEMILSFVISKAAQEQKIDMNVQVTHTDTFLAEMAARHNIIGNAKPAPLVIDAELVEEDTE